MTRTQEHFYFCKEINGYLPSVTKITGVISKGEYFNKWLMEKGKDAEKIKNDAGNFGSSIHNLLEAIGKGVDIKLHTLAPREARCVEAFMKWKDENVVRFLATEQAVYNIRDGYAGTLDGVVELKNGEIAVIDYKTSNRIYNTYDLQVVAYLQAYHLSTDIKVDSAYILRFEKDEGKPKDMEVKRIKDLEYQYSVFLSALKVWYWQNPTALQQLKEEQLETKTL